VVLGLPYAISVEPSGLCNLACPECPTGAAVLTRSAGMMDIGRFNEIALSLKPALMHVNLFFQGEPLLNRSLPQFIGTASRNRLYSLMSTNGQLMSESVAEQIVANRLTEIIFSVDGLTQETYQRYRVGGRLERVIASIGKIVKQKSKQKSAYPLITVQFIAFKHNEHEIDGLKEFTKSVGADRYTIKSAQFNDFGNGTVEPPTAKKYRRYNAGTQFRPTNYSHCWRQWTSPVVGWDGKVAPCCFDKDCNYPLGVIDGNKSMPQLWKDKPATEFRNRVLNDKYSMDICRNCPEGRGWW